MYTVVLLAAMTSGSATPDWHPRGGCHGVVSGGCAGSCYGCYGGNSFNGGGHVGGAPYGGTCIGTYGGYYSSGPTMAYGCWGCYGANASSTVYSGPGTYGFGDGLGTASRGISFQCNGCYGCYGGWSCYGSPTTATGYSAVETPGTGSVTIVPGGPGEPPVIAPSTPAPLPKKEEAKVRSKVIIELAENAKLFVDNQQMKSTSARRVFQTPELEPGQVYYYDVRVDVEVNGKVQSDTQRLVIRPGQEVTASFREPGRAEVVTVRAGGQ